MGANLGPPWGLEGSRGQMVGARGCILPIKWVIIYLGPDENPLGTKGEAVCAIWGQIFFEKNAFFGPKLAQIPHKKGQNGTSRGVWGGQFWVFEGPRPFGTPKKSIWSKIFFVKKTVFLAVFGSQLGHFVCKLGPNGHFCGV